MTFPGIGAAHKEVAVQVDTVHGVASLHPALKGAIALPWMVDPAAMTVLVGLLTSPPRYTGLALSDFWAYLRYLPAVDRTKRELRLNKLWSEVDSHQKTIMSDDFGMSAPALYMIEKLAMQRFVDTRWFAAKVNPGILNKISRKKGPAKAADFVCADSRGNYHLLECKGTQTSIKALKDLIDKGVGQKEVPASMSSFFESRMVGGLFIPQATSKQGPVLIFADPPEPDYFRELLDSDRSTLDKHHRRVWFSKLLAAAGLWRTATTVFDGEASPRDRDFAARASGELAFAGFETEAVQYSLRVEHRSFDLRDGYDVPVRNVLEVHVDHAMFQELAELTRANALGSSEFDSWLESRSNEAGAQGVESSIELVSEPRYSEVRTTFGLRYRLSSVPYE